MQTAAVAGIAPSSVVHKSTPITALLQNIHSTPVHLFLSTTDAPHLSSNDTDVINDAPSNAANAAAHVQCCSAVLLKEYYYPSNYHLTQPAIMHCKLYGSCYHHENILINFNTM